MRLALAALLLAAGGAAAQEVHPIFRWPLLLGKIEKSPDGRGIDIVAPNGEAVHAAGDGVVIYVGDEIASYGNLTIVRHADNYMSVYANLSEIAVKQGDKVKRGQIIGKSGHSGEVKRPQLHFELRHGEATLDPLGYLGPR